MKRGFMPDISEQELLYARVAIFIAVLVAGYVGINPPAYVAQVVAYAFGLAAASFFPAIVLGIFQKSMNKQGAIVGMIAGFLFTAGYIIYFKSLNPAMDNAQGWLLGLTGGHRHVRNSDQSRSRLAGGLLYTRAARRRAGHR